MGQRAARLIRQVELQAPLDLLAEQAAPIGRLLSRSGMPEHLQEPGDGFVPARHLLGFLACGARYLETEDFAFHAVLRAPLEHVGSWGRLLPSCWRLRDALRLFCRQIVLDAPFLQAGLSYGGEHAWLWRRRDLPAKDPFAETQGEQYTFGSMLKLVRMVAGSSWKPPAIRLESSASDWLLRSMDLAHSSVSLDSGFMAIAVPYDLLDLRMPRGTQSGARVDLQQPAADLAGSLQQALTPLLGASPLSIEIAAEVAETSPRTLRRWMAEEGTSWRQIRDRIRFEAAERRLLLEPGTPLAEIATDLGYSDQAHFARAFRRWTGEAPSMYRRRRLRPDAE